LPATQPAHAQGRRVVVLGSSTAAGAGPASPDSAWVPRYRRYALHLDPAHEVVNLALGGHTTYHVLPTGQVPPVGRPAPDPNRNITAALALLPDAIVVNLPSNDAALGYSVEEQLRNYDTLVAVAEDVPVWITTPQPRNLGEAGRALLRAMRDSTLARYAPHALDFWSQLARPDGTIEPIFDSGDGIHLNSAAHRILYERVAAAHILGETPTDIPHRDPPGELALSAWPAPFRYSTTIRFDTPASAWTTLTVHDATGRIVARLFDGSLPAGAHAVAYASPGASAGVYLVRLSTGTRSASLVVSMLR
jgi:lysophospholipase L1-like esterase